MLTTGCPSLEEQARRLRNLYEVQLSLMSRDGSATELRAVEFELIRTHRAIKDIVCVVYNANLAADLERARVLD